MTQNCKILARSPPFSLKLHRVSVTVGEGWPTQFPWSLSFASSQTSSMPVLADMETGSKTNREAQRLQCYHIRKPRLLLGAIPHRRLQTSSLLCTLPSMHHGYIGRVFVLFYRFEIGVRASETGDSVTSVQACYESRSVAVCRMTASFHTGQRH